MSHIAFVLGKPPKSSTIFPEVFDRLVTAGVETSVHLPHDGKVEEVVRSNATLVVHRGLDDTALRLVRDLHLGGTTLVKAGGALSAGDTLGAGGAEAAAGDTAIGVALNAAASGDLVEVATVMPVVVPAS